MALYCAAYFKKNGCDKLLTQKLLYYAQGIYLKLYNQPLFEEEIEKLNGPVVRVVDDKWDELDTEEYVIPKLFSDFLDDILAEFEGLTGIQLIEKIHEEPPWKETNNNEFIELDSLKAFFDKQEFKIIMKRKEEREKTARQQLDKYYEEIMADPVLSQCVYKKEVEEEDISHVLEELWATGLLNRKKREEKLWKACEVGNVEKVRKLLQNEQFDINWQDSESRTPFFIACREGHIEIVKLLLNDKRIDVTKAENEYGLTPFHIACKYGRIDIVKILLNDQRVDISKAENNEETPFLIACYYGHIEIVKLLLACGRENDLNKKDGKGRTGLYWAREREKTEIDEWESEEDFQERKRGYGKIVELIESFERNPIETRFKLKIQLGLAGKSF